MKKLLLTTAALAAFSTPLVSFADEGDAQENNPFYLRLDVMAAKPLNLTVNGVKAKSKYTFGADIGAGYYIMDNIRAELVFNHVFSPKFKNELLKTDYSASALMVRAFVDFADLGVAKLYAGAGVGIARVSAKSTVTAAGAAIPAGAQGPLLPAQHSIKAKSKNNLAWSAHLGAGFDVADDVILDVGYSYRHYGNGKMAAGDKKKATLRDHNLSVGVRFAL